MIKHDVHTPSIECHLTFAKSLAVNFISLFEDPKDLVNPASQDDGHLYRSLLIRRTKIYPGRPTQTIQNNIGDFGGVKYWLLANAILRQNFALCSIERFIIAKLTM